MKINLNFAANTMSTISNVFGVAISRLLFLSLTTILFCICSTACSPTDKTADGTNDATNAPKANSVVKAKVAIPKGLTFTNEMLDLGESKTDTKGSFTTKEELIGKKAGVDIPQDKIITSADVAKKDAEEIDDDDKALGTSEKEETTDSKEVKVEDSAKAPK